MFIGQFFSYCICCMSFRALADGLYAWTFTTDLVFSINSYFVMRRIKNQDSKGSLWGYTIGGPCGSVVAIFITKHLWGH
jgi:hypothetical protein